MRDAAPDGGTWRPAIKLQDRAADWSWDTTDVVLRKLRAASGQPGIPDNILGLAARLHDPWPEDALRGPPGGVIAQRDGAICHATVDGAVWITAITPDPAPATRRFKVPATMALAGRLDGTSRRRRATAASSVGTFCARSREPKVVLMPAVSVRSFSA